MRETVHLTIDGCEVAADPTQSILQAYARSGAELTANVGCLGQGVCGSCRCLIRKDQERQVSTALACETRVEAGMQVSFIDHFLPAHVHRYDLSDIRDSWGLLGQIRAVFPEAGYCRHCSGCDRACPKGLPVQSGVASAVAGDLAAAAAVFDPCVMCNLCTLACPENIRPNHLGLFVRRAIAALTLRPVDLMRRLRDIEAGAMTVEHPQPAAASGEPAEG